MGKNLTQKILEAHLLEGRLVPGEEIGIKIDHTLLQDATGTMAMLGFEALGIDRVRVELAAQYVDHNLLQTDYKNADDHKYLQTASARYGIHFSPCPNPTRSGNLTRCIICGALCPTAAGHACCCPWMISPVFMPSTKAPIF